MLTKNINFTNFKLKNKKNKIKNDLKIILKEKNEVLKSLGSSYRNSYKQFMIF